MSLNSIDRDDDRKSMKSLRSLKDVLTAHPEDPVRNGSINLNPDELGLTDDTPIKVIEQPLDESAIKLYWQRWLMLGLFALYSFSSAFQWIHLNIIGNVVKSYYNESMPVGNTANQLAIDSLSLLYMILYIPFVFPATYLLDSKGLKVACLTGAVLNATGAWVKCAALNPGRFPVLFAGQFISALAQIFVLEIPPHLAACWFGESEVSTATALGVFGNQLGVAVGFLVPPEIAKEGPIDQMHSQLQILLYFTAALCSCSFLLILFFFKSKPPSPPTFAQAADIKDSSETHNFLHSLRRMVSSIPFILLAVSYGINTGVYYAIGTLLNPIILAFFDNGDSHAGWIGLSLVLAGIPGSVLAGLWLDKTKKFKQTTFAIYLCSMLGMLLFTLCFLVNAIWLVYVTAIALGFFMTGYLPVGFEFAAEITYPEPEGSSAGILNASAQVFGVILTVTASLLLTGSSNSGSAQSSAFVSNSAMTGMLALGLLLTALIKSKLKRQAANQAGHRHLQPASQSAEEADVSQSLLASTAM